MKIVVILILVVFLSGCANGSYSIVNFENASRQKTTEVDFPELKPTKEMTQTADLIVSEAVYNIEDTEITFHGNLIVNGTAKLVVKNSILKFAQEYNNQYKISIGDESEADFDSVQILTNGKWMYAEITENPKITIKHYRGYDPNIPWWNTGWNSTVKIEDSLIGISVHGNSKLEADNSNLFLEPLFGNSTGTFTLPVGYVDDYVLDVNTDQGVFSVRAVNSTFREWGTTIMYNSNITFVDSTITIGINGGSEWPEYTSPNINVSGLKAKLYDYFELPFDTNHLTLVNTQVTRWYPQAFGGATMEISDSDLADLQWNGHDAKVIVKGSAMQIAFARNNVVYEIYDSEIDGDVTAIENSTINLYNTKVDGEFHEIDSGRIFVDGERFIRP